MSREHNDANVLALGGRLMGRRWRWTFSSMWLETAFAGGRHQRRVDKIADLERPIMRRAGGGPGVDEPA